MAPTTTRIISHAEAAAALDAAAALVFDADPRVHAVGVAAGPGGGFLLRATRNTAKVSIMAAGPRPTPVDRAGAIPVVYADVAADPMPLLKVPTSGPGSPRSGAAVPEQTRHHPLVHGLELQNFDDDLREGVVPTNMVIGTLGAFVALRGGRPAILSNNHVLAAQNRGHKAKDRILQPGTAHFDPADHVATLHDFVQLQASPANASPKKGNVRWNEVDAAVAALVEGIAFEQRALPVRRRYTKALKGTAAPVIGDKVYKVGRTTGLTHGVIIESPAIIGPVGYTFGDCWFRQSFAVEGQRSTTFSRGGDSGSLVVKATGEVVGLLFAGNEATGTTYCCPINLVLAALGVTLV